MSKSDRLSQHFWHTTARPDKSLIRPNRRSEKASCRICPGALAQKSHRASVMLIRSHKTSLDRNVPQVSPCKSPFPLRMKAWMKLATSKISPQTNSNCREHPPPNTSLTARPTRWVVVLLNKCSGHPKTDKIRSADYRHIHRYCLILDGIIFSR